MFKLIFSLLACLLLLVLLFGGYDRVVNSPLHAAGPPGVLIEEADGSPSGYAYKMIVPNTSLSITSAVTTVLGAGTVLTITQKGYGYINLTHPSTFSASCVQDTTSTNDYYGQGLFSGTVTEATNYCEYRGLIVPPDIDTTVNLTASLKVRLSAADTAKHSYVISMVSIADSSVADTAMGYPIDMNLDPADAAGAIKDIETVTAATLTDWKDHVTAGQAWVIRVARDGDDAVDVSDIASHTYGLIIRYGFTQ